MIGESVAYLAGLLTLEADSVALLVGAEAAAVNADRCSAAHLQHVRAAVAPELAVIDLEVSARCLYRRRPDVRHRAFFDLGVSAPVEVTSVDHCLSAVQDDGGAVDLRPVVFGVISAVELL